ncbi:MAG: hypothetical protein JSR56_04875 [Proteobacteria bacterium]|nr:hypothetical protein [Pseudomonadota bacterium]
MHAKGLVRKEQVLLCLAAEPMSPRSVAELRSISVRAGLRASKKWNLSAVLATLGGFALRSGAGWELTDSGKAEVARLTSATFTPLPTSTLRKLLPKIGSAGVVAFVQEAIESIEAHHYRAAVVLSWAGAVALLYDHVVAHELTTFNAEAVRRDAKWRVAKSSDDLSRMKEYDFLQILESISVTGKNVKVELENCLKLRNGCAHPNSLKIAEHRVNAHLETLVLNVYTMFI